MKAKKLFAAILSVGMIISGTTAAMAAPSMMNALDTNQVSASEGTVTVEEKSVEDITAEYGEDAGKVAEAIQSATVDSTLQEVFENALGAENIADLEIKLFQDGVEGEAVDLSSMKVLSPLVDLKLDGAEPTEENPVDVTFTANNMTDDIDVYVLHLCDAHDWEILSTDKTADNQVVATFHSFSPVALVYAEAADAEADVEAPATK